MRLFIAINFNDETRSALSEIQRSIKTSAPRGRFPDSRNFHLTLAFLGECDSKQLNAARNVLASISFSPFELTFERVGRFKRRGGDLWWAGITLTRDLKELHADVSTGMAGVGFELESRPFRPHVTLARQIFEPVAIPSPPAFSEIVRSVELMESTRINGRLTYIPLFSVECR